MTTISSEKIDLLIYGPIRPILENGFPDQFVVHRAESGEQLYVDTHDRRFRERFHDAAQRREDARLQIDGVGHAGQPGDQLAGAQPVQVTERKGLDLLEHHCPHIRAN